MDSATSALYEALIERDREAMTRQAAAFLANQSVDDLWVAVTRFAALAFAPSQHSRRALMACRAVFDLRRELGDRYAPFVIECARYAAASRRPWSEPPIVELPEPGVAIGADELQAAIATKDRERAERWLAGRLAASESLEVLRRILTGDALLTADSVLAIAPALGEKGAWSIYRLAIEDAFDAEPEARSAASLESLLDDAIAENGSIESVRRVFLYDASHESQPGPRPPALPTLEPYELARDFAQTLIAHSVAGRLPLMSRTSAFIDAVHRNLREGESFADWSQA